ncbi:hypothetical protein ACL6C3_16520 [Capilliphycus salinus ALCB114379]|uniref:hypothetical protein n=1 Tax=Capilliphycus salinus TaxID=2768948 RepID=UPI0039A63AE3
MKITKFFPSGLLGLVGIFLLNSTAVFAESIPSISSRSASTSDLKIHFQAPRSTSDVADNGTPTSEGTGSSGRSPCVAVDLGLNGLVCQPNSLALTAYPSGFFVDVLYPGVGLDFSLFSIDTTQVNNLLEMFVFSFLNRLELLEFPFPNLTKLCKSLKSIAGFFS